MEITQEQKAYARVAGAMILLNYVVQGAGDWVTIIARRGGFADTARYAAEHEVLWRFSLMEIAVSWISIGVLGYALYVLLEPVDKRLAQLALMFRLGASFVGAASLMLRYTQGWLYRASTKPELFTPEQLRTIVGGIQRGAGAGVETAWMFQGAGSFLFSLLLLRSGYVPRWMAWFGIVGGPVLVVASAVMLVHPRLIDALKLLGLPGLVAEVAMAVWLLTKGLRPK